MLPLNWCHLSDLIMHVNKKSQPINALRQVHSCALSVMRSHALLHLLPCVYPQRAFCSTANPRTASSVALRTVTVGMHTETLSRCALLLEARTHRTNRAAYFFCAYAPEPLLLYVHTQISLFCSAYPRNSPFSALRTHTDFLLLICVLLIWAEYKCATVRWMPRSVHVLERSYFIDQLHFPYYLSSNNHIRDCVVSNSRIYVTFLYGVCI